MATASHATGDKEGTGKDGNVVLCEQQSQISDDTTQIGLINLATGPITLLGSGPATAVSVQQICSGEDTVAGNGADAETGPGLILGLDLL
ncbi:hypothetical protein ACLGI4_00585 [Streptomyces sp. HMX112]|uniref:hypothetical protein n=1 Tax=Streptomyces sp. HMX112 TaxID=3390850 RepID=UPI003A80F1D0